ncbi:MAG: type II secretion system protein [Gemmatimonadetes bacterium]|nr:type II secretion system protein [Gemmatimonadota bacterium]
MKGNGPNPRREGGFSLIETLIVLTVLALAMLPLASTQFSSRRTITQADRQTQAMQVAVEQIERARMGGFGSAILDTIQDGEYEIFTQVVPDTTNPFLEEVQIVVNWDNASGAQSLTVSTKRASR